MPEKYTEPVYTIGLIENLSGRSISSMTKLIQLTLMLILFLNSSCIHISSTEHKTLELKSQINLQAIEGPKNLRINSLIYTESVYPLETFLKKLIAGEFNDAIRKVDLSYTPSNVDNQLISELIKEGLVPVFVKIENTSAAPVEINEKNFLITDDVNQAAALKHQEIPRIFTRFNSSAVAANAYNIGVVAVVYVGALIAIGIIDSKGRYSQGVGFIGSSNSSSDENKSSIINRTDKTTVIDYQNYLLGEKTIEPYSSVEGLLFFRVKSKNKVLKLAYK